MRAEDVYAGTLFALCAVIAWAGAVDCYFWLDGQPTLTDFLRAHPIWYYVPLVAILFFVALLTTHLFLSGK